MIEQTIFPLQSITGNNNKAVVFCLFISAILVLAYVAKKNKESK